MKTYMLEEEIENLLNVEAQRVFDILWNMTQNKEKINKSYVKLVYDIINDDYKCYSFRILKKIDRLIPLDWCINSNLGYVFIPESQLIEQLESERQNSFDKRKKINQSLIDKVANFIIHSYESDKIGNHSIMYFFSHYYNKYEDLNYDNEQINYLIEEIINKVQSNYYKVLKLNPLCLEKN